MKSFYNNLALETKQKKQTWQHCQNEIVEGQKCVKSVKTEMETILGMQLMSF